MLYLAKRIGVVVVACGPAAWDAYANGAGWRGAVSAFVGCVIAHQMKPATKGAK